MGFFNFSWLKDLGKAGTMANSIFKTALPLGTSLLGGLAGRKQSNATNSALENTIGAQDRYLEQMKPYADKITELAPMFGKATGKFMDTSGQFYGKAMKSLTDAGVTLEEAHKYVSSLMNDPQALAEFTASTNSQQAQQAQATRADLARVGGRSGTAAMLAGKTGGDIRKQSLTNRIAAKQQAAGMLPGIGTAQTNLGSTQGQLGTSAGQLAGDFAKVIPQLYTSAGSLLKPDPNVLAALSGLQDKNTQKSAGWGEKLAKMGGSIFDAYMNRDKKAPADTGLMN
jgi:DNA-binding transcriptional MerR regulator